MKIVSQSYTKISLNYFSESFGNINRKMRIFSKDFSESENSCVNDSLYDPWTIESFLEAKIRNVYDLINNFRRVDRNSENMSPIKIFYSSHFSETIEDIKLKLSSILEELSNFIIFIQYDNFNQIKDFSEKNKSMTKYSCIVILDSESYKKFSNNLKKYKISDEDIIEFQNIGSSNCSEFKE